MDDELLKIFPHEKPRQLQLKLLEKTFNILQSDKAQLLVHAPTGIGKTAAVLTPIAYFLTRNKGFKLFFITPKHSQHEIVLRTVQLLNNKLEQQGFKPLRVLSLMGKKHLCLQKLKDLNNSEFYYYCKALVKDHLCPFYENALKLKDFKPLQNVMSSKALLDMSRELSICGFELGLKYAKHSNVLVLDYNYLFNNPVREAFFKKLGFELERAVIVIDEAHNLPVRVRNAYSTQLSSKTVRLALREAKKLNFKQLEEELISLHALLEDLAKEKFELQANTSLTRQGFVKKQELIEKLESYDVEIQEFLARLELAADLFIKQNPDRARSFLLSIHNFLTQWLETPDFENGFVRIISQSIDNSSKPAKQGLQGFKSFNLKIQCLDPSIATKPVFEQAKAAILMSGTLQPLFMYQELLGLQSPETLVLENPFPKQNRLLLIDVSATTMFKRRNIQEFEKIASQIVKVVHNTNKTLALLPSYELLNTIEGIVKQRLKSRVKIFKESPKQNKLEKEALLQKFASCKKKSLLLGVIAGSYSEGIDLPGIINAVIIVGLPLQPPSLDVKAMIEYYNKKFGKGLEYGYLYPAIIKALQGAGRCIRSEHDKGVIIFLDERYAWDNYRRLFPNPKEVKISFDIEKDVKEFFKASKK